MFDIGFSELLLFGVIALIVLGPEKLPQAARTAGQWYSKIRRTVSTLQSEIEAELDLAETRQQMQKELAKIRQTEAEMRREMAEMRGSMQEFEHSQNQHHSSVSANAGPIPRPPISPSVSDKDTDKPIATTPDSEADGGTEAESIQDSEGTKQHADTDTPAHQTITTRPWENMWFRLGAYDKARRLPAPPYLPNYKADTLLSSLLDSALSDVLTTDISANPQESD